MSSKPDGFGTETVSRTAVWTGAAALAAALVLLAGSIFFSLPSNVLSVKDGGDTRRLSTQLFPQGWSFFTKPPSDSEVAVYRIEHGGSVAPVNQPPQAERRNLFGLSRAQRAQGPEVARIVAQVSEWTTCDVGEEPSSCAADSVIRSAQPIDNEFPGPTVCGEVVVVETAPVRWTFRHDYEQARTALQATRIEVRCTGR